MQGKESLIRRILDFQNVVPLKLKQFAAVSGLSILTLPGCYNYQEDFNHSDYRWEVLIELDTSNVLTNYAGLKLYTNTQPKVVLNNNKQTHLIVEDAVCPFSQQSGDLTRRMLENLGCRSNMGRYETATHQKVTIIDRQVRR